jgi:agmatinase
LRFRVKKEDGIVTFDVKKRMEKRSPLEMVLALTEESWRSFQADPLPGWASHTFTLFNASSTELEQFPPAVVDYAICSVPFDSTASTRIGARYGPRGIREASVAYSSQKESRGIMRLRNMRTGALVDTRPIAIIDAGDLHVYPTDPLKQIEATTAEIWRLAHATNCIVMLGGEHTLSFAGYSGVAAYHQQQFHSTSLGYIQIDNHFDFGQTSVLHGPVYHGSNGRRIYEHPMCLPTGMAFVGSGDFTSLAQYEDLIDQGITIRSMTDIRTHGFEACLRQALDRITQVAQHIYVSIDIDVCDASVAHGTGHVTVGGISGSDFLSIARILQDYAVVGLDIVEVSPPIDPTQTTSHLAARLLYEWMFFREVGV